MALPKRVQSIAEVVASRRWMRSQYRMVFGTPEGKAVLTDMARSAGMYDDCIGSSHDETQRNLGARRFVLRILKLLRMSEEELDALIQQGGTEE